MELRDIEYFSAVAKHGHLGRAAEALGLSQSALSKSLRRLEREMSSKLVKRTSKGVDLTAEGSKLLSRVQQLRISLDDVVREVADVKKGNSGHVRVGAGAGFTIFPLPAACDVMTREAPNASLRIRIAGQEENIAALRSGEHDVVIGATPAVLHPDLTYEHLYDDRYVVIASANHRLARKKIVTLFELARERWAQSESTYAIWQRMHRIFEDQGLPAPRITFETGCPSLRLPLIASSNLVGYSWESVVKRSAQHLNIVELPARELASRFRVSLVYRKSGYLSAAVIRFVKILKYVARNT